MATKKKAPAKKAAAKKATTTKTATSKTAHRTAAGGFDKTKIGSSSKVRSKNEILTAISHSLGIAKKEVALVFEAIAHVIHVDMSKGPGIFSFPGLLKIMKIHKPATKARKGVNPFTGEPAVFKAKPARNIVKVRALKALKQMV